MTSTIRLGIFSAILVLGGLVATARSVSQSPAALEPTPAPAMTEAAAVKLIESVCGSCHTTASILDRHRSAADWEKILVWMFDEGAILTDDEFAGLMGFLTVQHGRVSVNSAPAEEVQRVLELTDGQLAHIISARGSGRALLTIADLAATIGVPPASLETREARIDFGSD